MKDPLPPFARLLRRYRLSAELTQEQLAEQANLSVRAISDLERGLKAVPRRETVESLASALGLPVEVLEAAVSRRRGPPGSLPVIQLPHNTTPLFGRERDQAEVVRVLTRPDTRLLTLFGPGGVGKTRLALAAAAQVGNSFSDGVRYVPLASIDDPSLTWLAIANAVGAGTNGDDSSWGTVLQKLRDKNLLLVLDNFEHLLSAATVVGELLATVPQLRVLVTSRAPLQLRDEHRFEVQPLAVPEAVQTELGALAQYPCVELFTERAKAVRSDFELTADNVHIVAEICRRLDGLPLAIELAAARSTVLSPTALLRRLDDQLQVLTSGPRDFPERHQTMRAAIAWSYDLLEPREARRVRQLSVFVGGFMAEAAAAVCDGAETPSMSLLDDLGSLVDKSLLRTTTLGDGETRFVMLETVRQFSIDALRQTDEDRSVRDRHAEHFVGFTEQGYQEQTSSEQGAWFDRLNREQGNLRETARWIVSVADAERAARLGFSLWRYWDRRMVAEGRRQLQEFLRLPNLKAGTLARCKLLFVAGRLAYRQGDYQAAIVYLLECLGIARDLDEQDLVAAALTQIGHVSYARGDLTDAYDRYSDSMSIRRSMHDDQRTIAISLIGLARVHRARGDYDQARALLVESLARVHAAGDMSQIVITQAELGLVALRQSDAMEADRWYRESFIRAKEMGLPLDMATALIGLALSSIALGRTSQARTLLHEGIEAAQETGAPHLIAECLEGGVALLASINEPARAWMLAAAAAAYREQIRVPQDPAKRALLERSLDLVRSALPADERVELWAAGRKMSLDQAVTIDLLNAGCQVSTGSQSAEQCPRFDDIQFSGLD